VAYDSLTLNDTGDKITMPGAAKEELQKLPKFEYRAGIAVRLDISRRCPSQLSR